MSSNSKLSYNEWVESLSDRGSEILSEMLSDSQGCGRCGGDGNEYDGRSDAWVTCSRCYGTGQEPLDYNGFRTSVEQALKEEGQI